ncbi:ABC transporter ATP-binding protein [Streptomyces sp. MST-110588]|uniref:ATP-binding cassette domain-containing protein n=1 Tax=Streptomyces sp. MST-110588 TaxID=2833628 RepID=UPI001F5DC078|nr:ABC transporter ATP-binding protein [Streptomyces sp. MST-110588]
MLGALRHSAAQAAAVLLLGVASTGLNLALPALLAHTLDLLLAHRPAAAWLAACAALTTALVVCDALEGLFSGTTDARAGAWLRRRLLHHVLAAGPRAAGRYDTGDLVSRIVGNAAQAGGAPIALAATGAAVLTPLGALAALAVLDPWTAGAFLLGMPLLALLLRAFVRDTGDCVARYQEHQGEMAGRLVEAVGGARTIAAAGTGRRETARVLAPLPGLSRQGHRMWHVQGRSTAQAAVLVPLLQIAVLTVAGIRLSYGALTVGELLAVSRYATLATGVGQLVGHLNGLVRSRAAARRLAEVLQLPAVRYGRRQLPPGGGALSLRGVTVRHGDRAVLSGLDLTVPGGRTVAVVGRSGAGKTALAALAGRLADPDAGSVTLDGVPLPELDHDALRRAVGYAFERPALLGGTIHGTLALGAYEPGRTEVVAAARAACADPFVRRLPQGYRTPCAAAPLSGGEAQRLGLARAFAHAERLLVLDDATSSLDTVTELSVGRALVRDVRATTRLIVAHRASTAARADLVAWLDAGRVRALAPHAELWRVPEYRALFGAPGDAGDAAESAAGGSADGVPGDGPQVPGDGPGDVPRRGAAS